jgi:pilus assembly protein TadC
MTALVILAAGLCAFLVVAPPPLARIGDRPPSPAKRVAVHVRALVQRLRRPAIGQRLIDEAPAALEFLAVCLDAGAPVPRAVETVADVSPSATAALLRRVLAHLDVGRSHDEAWGELREHRVWGLPAREFIRSARSGTALASALRAHADDARRASGEAATKRARTVGVKSVAPLMACFLPAFVLIGVIPVIASLLVGFFD